MNVQLYGYLNWCKLLEAGKLPSALMHRPCGSESPIERGNCLTYVYIHMIVGL